MKLLDGAYSDGDTRVLWEDGELVCLRSSRAAASNELRPVLLVLSPNEHPSRSSLDRLTHEWELKDQLDPAWAVRPLELVRDAGRLVLVLENVRGAPLDTLLGAPMDLGRFLDIASAVASAVAKLHQHGFVHKNIKPANIVLDEDSDEVRLTGFGIASRLQRERESSQPQQTIAGSLAYMAPEQTGRMNRSIDSRSDLYALGITFYQMLVGALPFVASDTMEWVHCHVARRPVPPSDRIASIPAAVSAIVMKLLAKRAEDRYQTATGLERDLRQCLGEWIERRGIQEFPLGRCDKPSRLVIPEKLYGREREIETLLAAFDRVAHGGTAELVLVAGHSGVGKSSVVNELQPVLVPPRGLFASGKFDQSKADVPYSTLAQAFRSLIKPLLGKSETELAPWRDALDGALGRNARLISDLVPEVTVILGEPPPVPEVPPQDAQRRFHLAFRQFIGVFARAQHPLTLFLDDLQWVDPATLDLLEDLLCRSDLPHLLLVGAYRDNEVSDEHLLSRKLEAIRTSGRVLEITLRPLTVDDLGSLVADSLGIDVDDARPLAELVHAKTGGNPFFVVQFLHLVVDQGFVAFNQKQEHWSFDLDGIRVQQNTDNVIELLARKLTSLSERTQDALQKLACLGNVADISTLSIVLGMSENEVHATLWGGLRERLIERLKNSYRFVHDRVQEAAYRSIPEKALPRMHLTIGRLLLSHTPSEKRAQAIFDIVNQFDRGVDLVESRDEKDELAELYLTAGQRAVTSTAYASALHYLVEGTRLLGDDAWSRRSSVMFQLERERAECEFLTGDLVAAETRLMSLSSRAVDSIDRATVACLQGDVYTTLDRSDRAVQVCLDYLHFEGVEWSAHPSDEEVRREYERTWKLLGARQIEELIELPPMSDPLAEATMEVLTKTLTPALFTDTNLLSLLLWRMVNLSLEFGNTEASSQAYAHLWMTAGRFENHQAGFRFGKLGYDLGELRGFTRFRARIYLGYSVGVQAAVEGVRAARELIRRTFAAGNFSGDLTYAAFSWHHLVSNYLLAGDSLAEAEREAERGLELARKVAFGLEIDVMETHLSQIRTLRGLTKTFGCFDSDWYDEEAKQRHLLSDPRLRFAEFRYWALKLQASVVAGDHASAVEAARNTRRLMSSLPATLETPETHFYGALSHAAAWNAASPTERAQHIESLAACHQELRKWARISPETMQTRAILVDAEVARIEGRELEAERLYETAILSARTLGFPHNEAIASELAARFHAARGLLTISNAYLREARAAYARWGADGKVRQLESLHPFLREPLSPRSDAATIAAPLEQLDFATMAKASQAVSSEMVLDKLVDTLLHLALEHAGAERGLLLLSRANTLQQEAEATTRQEGIVVRRGSAAAAMLPNSIVQYVARSREIVLLDDASAHPTHASDPYVRERNARSVLCLPLLNEGKVIGVLYLENHLTPYAFTPERVAVLKVLASQAAISLENSRLYHDLADREQKIRRLVDSNILGICLWKLDGAIVEANGAFLHMLHYEREDIASGRLRWTEITPLEWREQDERAIRELQATGSFQPVEKEFLRKDGSRIRVLIGGALFEATGDEGVAFVLDLSERVRAENAARESEERFRDYAETGSDWFWEIGTDYRFMALTDNAFGFDAARRIGTMYWENALDFETEPEKWQLVLATLNARQPFRDFVYLSSDGKGTPMYVRASGKPLFDASGAFRGYRGTGTDVTAIMRAQEALNATRSQLAHAARVTALGALTASIAHEVNQPLSGIITNASICLRMLKAEAPNLEGARATAQRTLRDGNRAAEIVQRLRAMFAHKAHTVEQLDLNDAARELLELTATELRHRGVRLRTKLHEGSLDVAGDRVQLQQVILNLVLNAADAMRSNGDRPRNLLIATTENAEEVSLSVRDSGTGIDPKTFDKLFNAFYTTKTSGMGVGLSISRSIIETHRGRIWATNNDGPGATFSFALPRARN